ncbi:MAG: amidase [Acidobacteria bacterium]|nr:amidase [Acidobacteriota bacterium]
MEERSAMMRRCEEANGIRRRDFFKLAAVAAASSAVGCSPRGSQERDEPNSQTFSEDAPLRPLGNGEPPAFQFQAYPGGTGALIEKLWVGADGNPFESYPIAIPTWEGEVPTRPEEIAFLPVHRLSALIRDRHISPVDLTEIYLERIKRFDPVLLCAVTILEGRAREEAQQAEIDLQAGDWHGPLHGIPYGVKDLFSVTGAPTTWGSEDFQDQIIDEDAEVVIRLREAGAVLIAKLATGHFASGDNWYRGQTKNPWNPEQGSSGSSAGPASATAAGCVAFGIGTETQGSIVSPARRCGLSALRPTFGRISRYGGMVLSWSMDKIGPMCRTVEDCALVFNTIHGADEKDPATLTAPFDFERAPDLSVLRIGFTEDAPEAFVDKLRELGADPIPMVELPDGNSNSLGVESAAAFDFWVSTRPEPEPQPEPDPESSGGRGGRRRRPRFTGGREVLALDYVQSQRRRHLLMKEMAQSMGDFDMFVTGSGQVRLTNQTGHPAVVVPYGISEDEDSPKQPVCTTIVGALFADDKILSVAHAYQAATEWHLRHPDLA